jgi:hypothetical protein
MLRSIELGRRVKLNYTHEETVAAVLGYAFGSSSNTFKGFDYESFLYGYRSNSLPDLVFGDFVSELPSRLNVRRRSIRRVACNMSTSLRFNPSSPPLLN